MCHCVKGKQGFIEESKLSKPADDQVFAPGATTESNQRKGRKEAEIFHCFSKIVPPG